MIKKFFTYPVFLVLFLSFIGAIGFGALLRHSVICEINYCQDGGRFPYLQKTVLFFAEIPKNISDMIEYRTINLDKPKPLTKHKDKKRFEQFIPKETLF